MPVDGFDGTYLKEAYHSTTRPSLNTFKKSVFILSVIVASVAILVIVAVSPLALRQLGSFRSVNWSELSSIGQTYGAASALLTALALIGVVISMIFQVRAIKVSLSSSIRDQHYHLIEMALADPLYFQAWGHDPNAFGGSEASRQTVYTNLIVSFWESSYRLGYIGADSLHGDLAVLFRGEAGRRFWEFSRNDRMQIAQNRRDRQFSEIAEEEYQKAVTAGPPIIRHKEIHSNARTHWVITPDNSAKKSGVIFLIGAIGGFAIRGLIRR
jgi:hypothetical protein